MASTREQPSGHAKTSAVCGISLSTLALASVLSYLWSRLFAFLESVCSSLKNARVLDHLRVYLSRVLPLRPRTLAPTFCCLIWLSVFLESVWLCIAKSILLIWAHVIKLCSRYNAAWLQISRRSIFHVQTRRSASTIQPPSRSMTFCLSVSF